MPVHLETAKAALIAHLAACSSLGTRAGSEPIDKFPHLAGPILGLGYSAIDISASQAFASASGAAFAASYLRAFPAPISEEANRRTSSKSKELKSIACLADQALLSLNNFACSRATRIAISLVEARRLQQAPHASGQLASSDRSHLSKCISSGQTFTADQREILIGSFSADPYVHKNSVFAKSAPWKPQPPEPLHSSLLSRHGAANANLADFTFAANEAAAQLGAISSTHGKKPLLFHGFCNKYLADHPQYLDSHPGGAFDGNVLILPASMAGKHLGTPEPISTWLDELDAAVSHLATPRSQVAFTDPWESIELLLNCGLSMPLERLWPRMAAFASNGGCGLRALCHANAELALGRSFAPACPEPDLADTHLLHATFQPDFDFASALYLHGHDARRYGLLLGLNALMGRPDNIRALLASMPAEAIADAIPRVLGLAAIGRKPERAMEIIELLSPLTANYDIPAPWGMGPRQSSATVRGDDAWLTQGIAAFDEARKLRGEIAGPTSTPAKPHKTSL